ncbi:MAG: hypothetical protein L6R40_000591 [Gallowayella cf. fulva]|nr:MAG: hypothetical protein L6R40_000591 [Xanthomendoza cf. fulva]
MMRAFIICSIIGTAGLAVRAVSGTALPAAAAGPSVQYNKAGDTISTRDDNGPCFLKDDGSFHCGDIVYKRDGKDEDSGKDYLSLNAVIVISSEDGMSGKPLIHGGGLTCFFIRKDFVDNCIPLRKKATFSWDLFFWCYTQGACPKTTQKRDGITHSNPELTSDTAPGEPELLSRQDAFPVDVPREPNNVVKAAAREGHPVIHDGDSQGGQCWILHDDKGDCVKRFAEVKDFDMTIWGDCYKIEQCPKKRDALPEWPLADRDALHEPGRFGERDGAERSPPPPSSYPAYAHKAAKKGDHAIRRQGTDDCWIMREDSRCSSLRKHWSDSAFFTCYELKECPKTPTPLIVLPIEKRDALPEPGKLGESDGLAEPSFHHLPSYVQNEARTPRPGHAKQGQGNTQWQGNPADKGSRSKDCNMGSCDRFKKYHTAKLFNECEAAKVCHRTKRDALPEFSPMEHEALLEPSEFETRDALPDTLTTPGKRDHEQPGPEERVDLKNGKQCSKFVQQPNDECDNLAKQYHDALFRKCYPPCEHDASLARSPYTTQ